MADPLGIDEKAPPLTFVQWLICFTAAMGFAFDIYALLMLPLIVRPALLEMAGFAPGTPAFNAWVGRLFYIPAFAGGIFGLLGGYLTDRLGRRRILVWSILLYAFSTFASGFVTTPLMLLVFRCTTFIGVSVEFVAAVAWLAPWSMKRTIAGSLVGAAGLANTQPHEAVETATASAPDAARRRAEARTVCLFARVLESRSS